MKTIIAGSRILRDPKLVEAAVKASGFHITEVVSGEAAGIDQLGEKWAAVNGLPVKRFVPKWKTHGKAAGPIRNRAMAEYAQALIAIWNGKSKGTENMIQQARDHGLEVYVHRVK